MKHYHFTNISSTNDYARELIVNENELVITADYQTQGRGRKDRTWFGDFGKNLYLTYAFNHKINVGFKKMISYLAAFSVNAIKHIREAAPNTNFKIKYPNDILAETEPNKYKKISGILTEHIYHGNNPAFSLIGIGINVEQNIFPDEITDLATSLKLLGYSLNIHNFRNEFIEKISEIHKIKEGEWFKSWSEELNILNKNAIIIGSHDSFIIEKILNDGRLQLHNQNTNKIEIIDDGESIKYDI